MKYLVIGKNGQLGKEFCRVFEGVKDFVCLGRKECDIADLDEVQRVFAEIKPDVVINCAAYNFVDKAEEDYATAIKVNAVGVRNLAFLCRKYSAFLVHYSTDYVFDGTKEDGLYTEDDEPNPINEYGKSKFLGEEYLKDELERFLLFRVSWVYGEGRQNFICKLFNWAKHSECVRVSYDEVSVPTSARIIVDVTLKALKKGFNGLFHLTNSGYASRYEWAKAVFKLCGINKFIYPVSSEKFNLPAKRPKFSAMSNERISVALGIEIPSWEEELRQVLCEGYFGTS